jgi:hypothetical protein
LQRQVIDGENLGIDRCVHVSRFVFDKGKTAKKADYVALHALVSVDPSAAKKTSKKSFLRKGGKR